MLMVSISGRLDCKENKSLLYLALYGVRVKTITKFFYSDPLVWQSNCGHKYPDIFDNYLFRGL